MRILKALSLLSAGLVASSSLAGCFLPGGCGAPADPTNVQSFVLTPSSAATAPATIEGIASAPDGIWLLEHGAAYSLVELDRVGGTEKRHIALDTTYAFGLAWDGGA